MRYQSLTAVPRLQLTMELAGAATVVALFPQSARAVLIRVDWVVEETTANYSNGSLTGRLGIFDVSAAGESFLVVPVCSNYDQLLDVPCPPLNAWARGFHANGE